MTKSSFYTNYSEVKLPKFLPSASTCSTIATTFSEKWSERHGKREEVYLKEEKEDMIDLEYQSMLPVFQDAEYGSYLIIPLKYDETTVSSAHIGAFQEYPVETNDLMDRRDACLIRIIPSMQVSGTGSAAKN